MACKKGRSQFIPLKVKECNCNQTLYKRDFCNLPAKFFFFKKIKLGNKTNILIIKVNANLVFQNVNLG